MNEMNERTNERATTECDDEEEASSSESESASESIGRYDTSHTWETSTRARGIIGIIGIPIGTRPRMGRRRAPRRTEAVARSDG